MFINILSKNKIKPLFLGEARRGIRISKAKKKKKVYIHDGFIDYVTYAKDLFDRTIRLKKELYLSLNLCRNIFKLS